MKKITISIITLLTIVITAVFIIASPAYALENENRWSIDGDYYNYNWNGSTYTINQENYDNYLFEYFKTDDGWKYLAPGANATIKLVEQYGQTSTTRTIYLDDEVIATGTQGMGGGQQILFRYQKLETEVPVNPDPENPEEPEVPTPKWTVNDDGYTYYTGAYTQNESTTLVIPNIQYNIIEYSVSDRGTANPEWKLLSVEQHNQIVVKNIAQGYSSRDILMVVAGGQERYITEAVTAVNMGGTVIDQVLRVRYKEIDTAATTPVNQLPNTRGSIFTHEMNMGTVRFIKNGLNLTVAINYDGLTYYLQYSFDINQDMSYFNNAFEVFYYTHENEKFIMINKGEQSMFTNSNVKEQTFVPYVLWNLTTNEIQSIERFNTYIYTKKEGANNVYAYFYVDEFVIDQLLSVSLGFKYRYQKTFGGFGEWEEEYQVLEAGETNNVSPVSWQGKVMTTTAVATSIGALIPGVRWPVLVIGTAVMALTSTQMNDSPFSVRNIDQIQTADVDTNLRNELNAAYKKYNKDFSVDPNLNVFKLHLGQYDKFLTAGIDIDTEYSIVDGQKGVNIIQFTYMTDGKIYTISGDNINTIFVPGTGTDGKSPTLNVKGGFTTAIVIIVIVGVGFAAYKNNAAASPKKAIAFILGTVLVLSLLVVIYIAITSGALDLLTTIILRV